MSKGDQEAFIPFSGSLELTLNGSYQVTYRLERFTNPDTESYSFRVKTNEKDAIILHAKSERGDNDELTIEIRNSMLQISSNVGEGKLWWRHF